MKHRKRRPSSNGRFMIIGLLASAPVALACEPATISRQVATTVDQLRLEIADNERWIRVPESTTIIRLWDEVTGDGERTPAYAISLDGRTIDISRETDYRIQLRYSAFDPRIDVPAVPAELVASEDNEVYIVQFETQPLAIYRESLDRLGATIHKFLPNHSYLVRMDDATRAAVNELPFVRWVGAYHPAYKLDPALRLELFPSDYAAVGGDAGPSRDRAASDVVASDRPVGPESPIKFNIQVFERGAGQKNIVADRIRAAGGRVDYLDPNGFLLVATLDSLQLMAVLASNEVMWVDLWSPPEDDMNIVREIGGANYLENETGFSGEGVRAEVMDGNVRASHVDFQSPPVLVHGSAGGDTGHGTPTYGINFATGTGNPNGRGMLPDAEAKIFADYDPIYNGSKSRYDHTAELVDPNGKYRGVFQSNSWGNSRTRSYNTYSMEMDDILFLYDLTITQSQSNAGNQDSRPQAWAKNIVSVGGVYHQDTPDRADDRWSFGGSTGPASDGRVKPDLTHFYDDIFTTSDGSDTSYTATFGGTSGATPITSGHFGLMYQMWHEGSFEGFGGGPSVFDDRPHMSTAKALMINSAFQYGFPPKSDMDRFKQGWGMVHIGKLYDNRDRTFIINESEPLQNLESWSADIQVEPDTPELKATMVYTDTAGNTGAKVHRINDLALKLTSPTGVEYWGNFGLDEGHWSLPGGKANDRDTVENVYVQNPEVGVWTVEVTAPEIVEDARLESPEMDADFALVVSGALAAGGNDLALEVTDLFAGEFGTAVVFECTPGAEVYVAYSKIGLGERFIPDLNVTLGIRAPILAAMSIADRNGRAVLARAIAPDIRDGRQLWIQAAEYGRTSNVVEKVIIGQ